MIVTPSKDAEFLNSVINDPTVRPSVWPGNGPLDAKALLDAGAVFLRAEHGGFLLEEKGPGLFEVHTVFLPEGRGSHALEACRDGMFHMFTTTPCVEVITRISKTNVAAKRLARSAGMKRLFQVEVGNFGVPDEIYSIRLDEWAFKDPRCVKAGEWFHGRFDPDHEDEPDHDRFVGATVEQIKGGQVDKALFFYNRWALMAGYASISLKSREPLVLDIVSHTVRWDGENMEVTPCR